MTAGKPALSLSHLRFHLVAEQPLRLPAHNKGNALRGGFGSAFRRLVCVDMRWECVTCSLRCRCPYTMVFNPFIPPDAPQFSGNRNIPRPFVFKPPLSLQTAYIAGESLVFDLVVVGQALDYLPYFIVAFRELGASGFGLNRARFRLDRAESLDRGAAATPVYDAASNVVRPPTPMAMEVVGSRPTGASVEALTPSLSQGEREQERNPTGDRLPATDYTLTLDFLTPTTLTIGSAVGRAGDLVRRPAFHHVVKRLRDRVNALATFYGDGPLDLDFKALGAAAEGVETVEDRTHWVERTRFSRHRGVQHDLSGFIGSLQVRGDLAPFLPLLRIGEYVHVGKNAVFGNGWLQIRHV
ncbi:MAG: CRISPR system precrRNA processing endoribonuclease RAMP protein Cas6 [Candidatus Binatia bacterium]